MGMLALAAKAMAWVSFDAIESSKSRVGESSKSRVGGVGEVGEVSEVDGVCMGQLLGLSIGELAIIDFKELANSSQLASAVLNLAWWSGDSIKLNCVLVLVIVKRRP
jgi:hypothetical protein